MHISIFEEEGFVKWGNESVNERKESILRRAMTMLYSVNFVKRDIKSFRIAEQVLFSNLEYIKIIYDDGERGKIYNTCLETRCFTLIWDISSMEKICKEHDIGLTHMEKLLTGLADYVTDSVIIEWKNMNSLDFKVIKVERPGSEKVGFFPISYELADLIFVIEQLFRKVVKFEPLELHSLSLNEIEVATVDNSARLTRDSIICTFIPDRLDSEYAIAVQLVKLYLHRQGFIDIPVTYFNSMSEWVFDEENLRYALHIIIQNKTINLLIEEDFPIYQTPSLYTLINFKRSECYLHYVCQYLCAYAKKSKLCSKCMGIDDVNGDKDSCPLYKENSVMDRFFALEEIISPELQEEAVDILMNAFLNK